MKNLNNNNYQLHEENTKIKKKLVIFHIFVIIISQ